MTTVLLATKLMRPVIRPMLVVRERLLTRLQRGLDRRLTVVSAPAGFGKTTLLGAWVAQVRDAAAADAVWLSLDANDNDPVRFFNYFVAALRSADLAIGQSSLDMLQSPQLAVVAPSADALMTLLINDLVTVEKQILVVLDDYHIIHNATIQRAITFLVDNMPPQLHLVLSGRTEPALPLPRWRVRGHIIEINSADLRFMVDEAVDFFNRVMGLDLSAEAIATLDARTEGWIAGLQLAALSLQSHRDRQAFVDTFQGDHRYVMDYMAREVFQQQSETMRDFLLCCAVLPQLNADLCAAVSGKENSRELLAELDQRRLFIVPLDERRKLYRFHNLFADFLHARLIQTDPARLSVLHARASQWHAAQGMVESAIEHVLQTNDESAAIKLLLAHANTTLWDEGRVSTLLHWLDQVSHTTLLKTPRLAITKSWAYLFDGRVTELRMLMLQINERYADLDDPISIELRGELSTLNGELALYRGDIPTCLAFFEDAMLHLPAENVRTRAVARQIQGYALRLEGEVTKGIEALSEASDISLRENNQMLWIFAQSDLAELEVMAGLLNRAERRYRDLLGNSSERVRPLIRPVSVGWIGLGRISLLRNDLTKAEEYLQKGLSISSSDGEIGPMSRYAYSYLARVWQAQGKSQKANELMRQSLQWAEQTHNRRIRLLTKMQWAQLHMQQGDVYATRRWLTQRSAEHDQINPNVEPRYQAHLAEVMTGRVALFEKQYADAVVRLSACRTAASDNQWSLSQLEIDILLALAYHGRRNMAAAFDRLQTALASADAMGVVRLFIDEGAPMVELLRSAVRQGIEPILIGRLQAAFLPDAAHEQPLLAPLTDRERTVLKLMSEGLSNREIAAELVVAIGTVGKYTNNIYSKLHVRNRTEATNRAKALKLV